MSRLTIPRLPESAPISKATPQLPKAPALALRAEIIQSCTIPGQIANAVIAWGESTVLAEIEAIPNELRRGILEKKLPRAIAMAQEFYSPPLQSPLPPLQDHQQQQPYPL